MNNGRPLRVLALLEATSISGTGRAVLELAYEAQADAGDRSKVDMCIANFTRGSGVPRNSLVDAMQAAQVPLWFIRERHRFDWTSVDQIRQVVKLSQADVVWTNSVKSHFLVHQARMGQVCPWVAFHHGYTLTDAKMRLYNQADRLSLRHANRVVAVCGPLASEVRARGVQPRRIHIQHMPIRRFPVSPLDAAALRVELGLDPESKVILTVGRLSYEKGHRDLIAAFAALHAQMQDHSLRLVVVGDGPELANLKRLSALHGAGECILFTGHRDDARRFYGIADVFALPSYLEGTPNVVLESMAAGVPVVSTCVGGLPEMIANGKNGLLVPPGCPAQMANALGRILESAELRRDLSEAAQQVVAEHTPRRYFEHMRQVFTEATQD